MFDGASRTGFEVSEVMVQAIVRFLDRGGSLSEAVEAAIVYAHFMEWLLSGDTQGDYAKCKGMSLSTFRRRLDMIMDGKQRATVAKTIVTRHLVIALRSRLEARGPLSTKELVKDLATAGILRAAAIQKVSVPNTLLRMETRGEIADKERRWVVVGDHVDTPLPTKADRVQENAHTAGLFLRAAMQNERAIYDDSKTSDLVVSRIDAELPELTPEERDQINHEIFDAIQAILKRRTDPGRSCHRVTVAATVIHERRAK